MTGFSGGSNQWLKVGLLLPIVALNGWVIIQIFQYLEPLATIFIVAAVLAFILNYPVEFLQKQQVDRNYAVLIVLLGSLVTLVMVGVTLVPALLEELSGIVDQLPGWLNTASQKLQEIQHWAAIHRLPINLNRVIGQFTDALPAQLEGLSDETVMLTLNAFGGLSSLLLTLVLTLYLLLDGKRVWNVIFRWLPLNQRDRIRRSLQNDFHCYFIGQATLGLIMGGVLSIVFVVLNVPYSLLLGSTVGVMALIPFGDTLGYILICLLLTAKSPALGLTTLAIAIVLDQLIDQAIAPRILGGFTGLKPIWVIIALLLGTKLFGFSGLITAVPLASFINSLVDNDSSLQEQNSVATPEREPGSDSSLEPPENHATISST